jgi:hypothetical protein
MHLIYYGKDVLDLRGLPTLYTVGIIVGATYGCLRLLVDAVRLFGGALRSLERILGRT